MFAVYDYLFFKFFVLFSDKFKVTAEYHMLHGKALNILPNFDQRAQDRYFISLHFN